MRLASTRVFSQGAVRVAGLLLLFVLLSLPSWSRPAPVAAKHPAVTPFGEAVHLSEPCPNSSGARIAVSGTHVYVVWLATASRASNADIFLRASSDEGNTFGPQVNVSNSSTPVRNPCIAANGDNVYVVWEQKRLGAFNFETTFARSIDNGATFGVAQTLSNTSAIQSAEQIHIAASGDNMYVTWSRSDGSNPQLHLARSTTGGASFGAGINISNHDEGAYDQQLAADGDNVYVVWRGWDTPRDTDQVYFQANTDGAVSFSSSQDLSNNPGAVCCIGAISLAAAGGKVYAAWGNKSSGGGDEVYVSQGTAGAMEGRGDVGQAECQQ